MPLSALGKPEFRWVNVSVSETLSHESFYERPKELERKSFFTSDHFGQAILWKESPVRLIVEILDNLRKPFNTLGAQKKKIAREAKLRRSVDAIKNVIRSRDSEDIAGLEAGLYLDLHGQEDILSEIANDSKELINVRAMAARLFIARVFSLGAKESRLGELADRLAHHESPLIRLGALLGYSDADETESVQEYLSDPHPVVREQAQEILEDAE